MARTVVLANMHDHLLTMQAIQDALSREQYHRAAKIAEVMPPGMQSAGSETYRAASRFALAAKDARATGDIKPALHAPSTLTAQCVACHAGWRVQ